MHIISANCNPFYNLYYTYISLTISEVSSAATSLFVDRQTPSIVCLEQAIIITPSTSAKNIDSNYTIQWIKLQYKRNHRQNSIQHPIPTQHRRKGEYSHSTDRSISNGLPQNKNKTLDLYQLDVLFVIRHSLCIKRWSNWNRGDDVQYIQLFFIYLAIWPYAQLETECGLKHCTHVAFQSIKWEMYQVFCQSLENRRSDFISLGFKILFSIDMETWINIVFYANSRFNQTQYCYEFKEDTSIWI